MPEHFYITTPIYYVNDAPHIGHAYTTILADVLARYQRLLGVPTHFLTGTDEHGQKVEQAARENATTPQEWTDRTVVLWKEAWEHLEISHDDFIRTTEDRHKAVVQEILQDLHDRDEIYRADYEGWYSVSEERFYTEKDLVDGKSPEGKPVEKIIEPNYFFRMGKYQEWLVEYIETHEDFIRPTHRRNETLGYLQKPLGDLCISRPRTRLPWGVTLPFDEDYVCYVWFDALVNYISAVGYRRDDALFAQWWPASYHLVGKDILTTHTVYWPTMLKAMGVEMPQTIFAHGWWLSDGGKMGKSEGNAVSPMDMVERFGVDALRYYLMAEMSLGSDANFTEENFISVYNASLANDLGNMTNRALTMIRKNCGGIIPEPGESTELEESVYTQAQDAVTGMQQHLVGMQLHKGIEGIQEVVRGLNRYFEATAPWKLAKAGDTERLNTVLYTAADCLRIVSGLLYPVIPGKMTTLRTMMGLSDSEITPDLTTLRQRGGLKPGRSLGELETLFPRVE